MTHPPEPSPSIEDLAWLAGTWRGEVDGQQVEEIWGEPLGRSAVGVFRWMDGDALHLCEILLLEEVEGTLWMRLRHFGKGLAPWVSESDGPMAWPLVSIEGRRAVFENEDIAFPRRLVYQRTAQDALDVQLVGAHDGKPSEMTFHFTRS